MELRHLTTLHEPTPLGIDPGCTPYFGWQLRSETPGTRQTAYRLQVSGPDGAAVWDTGRVGSGQAAFVTYRGPALASRTRYTWTVTAWDNHGGSASAASWFETALAPADWQAAWMRTPRAYVQRQKGFGTQPPATLFRRSFTLDAAPAAARLYLTCLGVYRLTVNGKRPDDREFAPEHTSYRKTLCYQTYDVTGLLRAGENVLGVEVGDGWYCCPQTQPPIDGLQPDHTLLFQLEVTGADGRRQIVISDESLQCSEGEVRSSDLFDGEAQDWNQARPGWDAPGFDAAGWAQPVAVPAPLPAEALCPEVGGPVRPVRLLPAVKVYRSPKNEWIVDFGQVVTGRTRVAAQLPAGAALTLEHFEATEPDGSYHNSVQSAMGVTEQKDVFVSDGAPHTYEARFTFHGFRYLRVTGLDTPQPAQFTAVVLASDKADAGTFACSDARLNRLYENTRWSQRGNTLSIPTDCPQREKAGWTGDIALYARTMLLNEDATSFLTRWLHSLACDQRDNGSVPFTVPDTSIYHYSGLAMGEQTGCGGPVCSAGWGDAAIAVPWAMYEITGNTEILKTQYASMKGWVDYILDRCKVHAPGSTLPDEVEETLWDTGFQFGEWLIPSLADEPMDKIGETMAKSASYTAPIFGWRCCDLMAQAAAVLGREADAAFYQKKAAAMKKAIAAALIDGETSRMRVERQGAYVLMLAFDLVPTALRGSFGDRLAKLIHQNGDRLDTGFLGTPWLLDALCESGHRDLAWTLLFQEESPAWLAQVKSGATTIWESWEMYDAEGHPKNESFNHYAFGCVDDWMFRTIAGLDQTGAGYRHLVIAPQPDKRLTWAERRFFTEQGEAAVHWRRENGVFTLTATVPCNADAEIRLPDGSRHTVGSGTYTYTVREG